MKVTYITIKDSLGRIIKRRKSTTKPFAEINQVPLITAQISRLWTTSLMKNK